MVTNRKQNKIEQTVNETNLLNTKQNKSIMRKLRQSIIDKYRGAEIEPHKYGLCVADSNLIFKFRAVRVSLDVEFSVANIAASIGSVLNDLDNRATFKGFYYHMRSLTEEQQHDLVQITAITLCELKGIERYYDEIVNIMSVVCRAESLNAYFCIVNYAFNFDFTAVDHYVALDKKYLAVAFNPDFLSYTKHKNKFSSDSRINKEYLSLDYVRENKVSVVKFIRFNDKNGDLGMTAEEGYEYYDRIFQLDGEHDINYYVLIFKLRRMRNVNLLTMVADNKIPVEAFKEILYYVTITEDSVKSRSSGIDAAGLYTQAITNYLYQNILKVEFCHENGRHVFKLSNSCNDICKTLEVSQLGKGKFDGGELEALLGYTYINKSTTKYYRAAFIEYWNINNPLWKIDKEVFMNTVYDNYLTFGMFVVFSKLIKYPKLTMLYNVFPTFNNAEAFIRKNAFKYDGFSYEKTNPREMLGISKYAYKLLKLAGPVLPYTAMADLIFELDSIIDFGIPHEIIGAALKDGMDIIYQTPCAFFKTYIALYEDFFKGVLSKKVFFNYVNKIIQESYLHGGGFEIMRKQNTSYYDFVSTYRDYIRMCKQMDIEPIMIKYNEKVKFPELNEETGSWEMVVMDKLKKYHDDLVKVYKVKEDEFTQVSIDKLNKKHSKLKRISVDGFSLMLAPDSKSIVNEGQVLSHCIGSYIRDYADGKRLIAFFRSDDNLKTPLCTMEIKIVNGEYKNVQFKAYKNRKPLVSYIEIAKKMIDIANS